MSQPSGGGRRRLYCCNAHRAEARRLRLAATPATDPADLLSTAVDRLAQVLHDLQRHQLTLQSVDPARHGVELARLRAEATSAVLAAQQIAAQATEDASTASERLAIERGDWERERGVHVAELDSARDAVVAATERAASLAAELNAEVADHRSALEQRDRLAAAMAAAHESDLMRIADELNQARVAAAAGQARADSADQRAARADDVARTATDRAEKAHVELNGLLVDLARAHGTIDLATARAETAERLLGEAGVELRIERERHDARVSQLHDQISRLASRIATKTTAKPKTSRPRPSPGPERSSEPPGN